ncbi:MAG: hypothetical protein MK102_12310 [Fuerstiella sp.]|nr:hypothetical protein [Fuerstiella sp.]
MFRARLLVVCWLSITVAAQQSPFCTGQDDNVRLPVLQRGSMPAGVAHYVPQKWGTMGIEVVNPALTAREVIVATHFADNPDLQYARRLWLPPLSTHRSTLLVLPPGQQAPETGRYGVNTMLLDSASGEDALVKTRAGHMIDEGILPAGWRPIVTKSISDQDSDADEEEVVMELSSVAKLATGRSRLVSEYRGDFLPESGLGLQAMDQLILSSDRIAEDTAGLAAVRDWLHSGGRLWIMLDQLEPETLRLLLGETFDCQVIDRVGLTELQINGKKQSFETPDGELRQFEEPVELARVMGGHCDVAYSVNGWPAAFWKKVGQGEILFTTLGPRAWIRPRQATDKQTTDPLFTSPYVATSPLQTLADRFFQPSGPPPIPVEHFGPILAEQIGYHIADRGLVAATLASFCGSVLFGGLWLIRRGRLEQLGWLGPVIAIAAASVIAFKGASLKQSVPNTLAEMQFVQTAAGSDTLQVSGLASLYYQNPSQSDIGSTNGGVLVPHSDEPQGEVNRMLWTDLDSWHWQNLTLPPGEQSSAFEVTATTSAPLQAKGRFGPGGFEGRVSASSLDELTDAIIATPGRENLAVQISPTGTFTVHSEDVLPRDQFVAATLLSDEQRRRQTVYRRLIPRGTDTVYPDRPTLFAWAPPVATGFEFPEQTRKLGTALFAMPLVMERTSPDSQVAIPSPFLPYRTDREKISSSTYVNRTGEWVERQSSTKTWLRVQFPDEVLPMKLDRVFVMVRITGPVTRIEIARENEGEPVVIASDDSPVGNVKLEIDRTESLVFDERGGLTLGVFVFVPEDNAATVENLDAGSINLWKIDSLRIEAEGMTLNP